MKSPNTHERSTSSDRVDATSERTAARRKPYEKPSFVREQLFETMALACGKTNPSIGQCART